jgi:hypothetical protein
VLDRLGGGRLAVDAQGGARERARERRDGPPPAQTRLIEQPKAFVSATGTGLPVTSASIAF